MKHQYFLKDKKAQIYKRIKEEAKTFNESPKYSYYPIAAAPIWCYSKQRSADLDFIAHTFTTEETRFFVFNYHKNVKPYDYILYRDTWYEITRVDTQDDYNGELFVYVQDAPIGIAARNEEIKDYDPEKWQ